MAQTCKRKHIIGSGQVGGLLFRLQLKPNHLEGRGESASYGLQDFPSSWGLRFPLGQKDEVVVEDNILKVLFGSGPHHAE